MGINGGGDIVQQELGDGIFARRETDLRKLNFAEEAGTAAGSALHFALQDLDGPLFLPDAHGFLGKGLRVYKPFLPAGHARIIGCRTVRRIRERRRAGGFSKQFTQPFLGLGIGGGRVIGKSGI